MMIELMVTARAPHDTTFIAYRRANIVVFRLLLQSFTDRMQHLPASNFDGGLEPINLEA